MNFAYLTIWNKKLASKSSQSNNQLGIDTLDLAFKVRRTGANFVNHWVAILGRTALDNVGNKNFFSLQPNQDQKLVQKPAGAANKRLPLFILVGPGTLSNKHYTRFGVAFPRNNFYSRPKQSTFFARAQNLSNLLQQFFLFHFSKV